MSATQSYLVTRLCAACTRGDLDNVKRLIERGASSYIWIRDDKGNTLFHLCCSSVQCGLEVLEYLISVPSIVDYSALVNNEGSTLLHLACDTGKLKFVRYLFSHHRRQDSFVLHHNVHGHTPLYYACKIQHSDIVSFICNQNIVLSPDDIYQCVKISTWKVMVPLLKKISFKNFMERVIQEDHMTLAELVTKDNTIQWLDTTNAYPLHYFSKLGDTHIVAYLISKLGYDKEAYDNKGRRPLHIAHCVDTVKYLVEEAGCDINSKGPDDNTFLHIACKRSQFEVVKFLTSKAECDREACNKHGDRPLHLACVFSSNVELVCHLIKEAGCNINAKGFDDYTCLHIACEKSDLSIVKFLTSEHKCDVEAEDKYGNRPLHIACAYSNNVDLVRHLVEAAGCDISANKQNGYTLLHMACANNQLEIVKFLTSKCNHELVDRQGNRPLHIACNVSDSLELVTYLVEEVHCDINAKGQNDCTALHIACKRKELQIVKLLTSKPDCDHEIEDKYGQKLLYMACTQSNNIELVKYLVDEAGCDINGKGCNGYTALHAACYNKNLDIVKFLTLKPFCNKELKDKCGKRPLHIACESSGNLELVIYLLEVAGCNINAKGPNDYTPLHIACEKNRLDVVKFLTSKQECNCEIEDKHDNRPLHVACEYSGNIDLVKHLIEEAGCDVTSKGKNDYTPLHIACVKGQLELVEFLISKIKCNKEAEGNNCIRPLHLACEYSCNVGLVSYLVKVAHCDVNAKRLDGYTPLHIACEKDRLNVVKILVLVPGCNQEAKDNYGNRPLHIACTFSNSLNLIKYLVEEVGCDVNAKGRYNYTPLKIACNEKKVELVEYLTAQPECSPVESLSFDGKLQRLLDHHNKYQQALKSTGVAYLQVVKCVLTGPPGAGKSTLKKKLLNESLIDSSVSTGVLDGAIPIETYRKLQQDGAIVHGETKEWRKQTSEQEAAFILESLSDISGSSQNNLSCSSLSQDIEAKREMIKDAFDVYENISIKNEQIETNINPILLSREKLIEQSSTNHCIPNLDVEDCDNESGDSGITDVVTQNSVISVSKINENKVKAVRTLSNASQNVAKGAEYQEKLHKIDETNQCLLHIIDTGGQPEFHEILPALITGPAINLLVFKLTEDLRNRYSVTHRMRNDQSEPYKTSLTHEEVIFRSLASIACLRQNTIGWKIDHNETSFYDNSEPSAFLIATHRDCVEDSKVAEVNEQLKQKIQNSHDFFHKSLVQFSTEHDVIFALDTIKDQVQIEHLRTTLQRVISNNFHKLSIPASWCALKYKLQKTKKSIFKLDACYKLAKDCGISERDDFMSALWYLHHRVGSIMHYPDVEGLQDIVITGLQVVFNRITHLITSSFTFKETGNASIANIFSTTGRFSESHLKSLSRWKSDPLTPQRIVFLLKHLHIVAGPINSNITVESDKYYFMPCALKPTSVEIESRDQSTSPAPLLVYFECGYNPVGVFCCLVVYLLSSTSQSGQKWTLEKPPHFRNKITFSVGQCFDHITLISRATYLEVWIDRAAGIIGAIPFEEFCPTIYNTLNIGIKTVTKSLHYTYRSNHFFGFLCTTCQSSHPHPAICKYDNPLAAKCVNGRSVMPLEEKHKIWFDKIYKDVTNGKAHSNVLSSMSDPRFFLTPDKHDLLELLADICHLWFEIGESLIIPNTKLMSLQHKNLSDSLKLSSVLQYWKDQCTTDTTWRRIINAVMSKTVGQIAVGEEMKRFVLNTYQDDITPQDRPNKSPSKEKRKRSKRQSRSVNDKHQIGSEEKKYKKPKLEKLDESSSSDNSDSEFNDKSSRLDKEPASGRSYKRKGIPGKGTPLILTSGQRKHKREKTERVKYSDSNSSDEHRSSRKQVCMHTLSDSDSESCDISIEFDKELNRKHWQKRKRGDMKQITEHTKSDHSDEDIPPSKLECIDQHTSLDIDLRSPFIRCDRKPVSRTSCHERKGVPAKGGKRKREEVDSDFSEEHVLRNSNNISPSPQNKQKDTCDLISTSLNSEIAGRALIQCIDTVVESSVDPFALVRKLYSKEVISKDVYKKIRDKESRDTCGERLEKILDDIEDRIKHDANVFVTFLDVLIDLSQKDLADIIKTKYKELERKL